MKILSSAFPPVSAADEYGIVAIGAAPYPELLIDAYTHGIFPWPHPEIDELPWFSPLERGLLFFNEIRGKKRILRYLRNSNFDISFNTAFEEVMRECGKPLYRSISSTWITEEMIHGYSLLHTKGLAHSVEIYQNKVLVGGLYGVSIGRMFAAESMFYRVANASKCALIVLCEFLNSQGVNWLDCQQLTKHLESLGGREVHRDYFISLLNKAVTCDTITFPKGNISIDSIDNHGCW